MTITSENSHIEMTEKFEAKTNEHTIIAGHLNQTLFVRCADNNLHFVAITRLKVRRIDLMSKQNEKKKNIRAVGFVLFSLFSLFRYMKQIRHISWQNTTSEKEFNRICSSIKLLT